MLVLNQDKTILHSAITGSTGRFLKSNGSVRHSFFNEYNNKTEFAIDFLSIAAAPIPLIIFAVNRLLEALISLIASIFLLIAAPFMLFKSGDSCSNNLTASKNCFSSGIKNIGYSFGFMLAAILSPVVNLTNVIGSCAVTFKAMMSNDDVQVPDMEDSNYKYFAM